MIKLDIVNRVVEKTGITKTTAEMAVDAFIDALKDGILRHERMEFRGFGVFTVQPRKRGLGRNPRTGETMPITPGWTARFKPGLELKAETDSSKLETEARTVSAGRRQRKGSNR